MYINKLVAAGALLSLASAVPLQQQPHKRDIEIQTKVAEDIVTHTVWTTVYVTPSATPKAHFQHAHFHFTEPPPVTRHITQTVRVHPQPAPSPGANSAPAPPAQPSEPPAANSQPAPQAPPSPSAPAASPSAPAQSPSAPPSKPSSPPQSPTSPQPSPSPSGGSSPSGQKFSGDITYYTPGLGSCGVTNTGTDMIVALAADVMEQWTGNPNDNPNCGKSITISYNGVTAQATIEDTCPGCSGDSLDLTPSLFEKFASLSVGRVSGVEWWFN